MFKKCLRLGKSDDRAGAMPAETNSWSRIDCGLQVFERGSFGPSFRIERAENGLPSFPVKQA
jgi:hypothetical protein